MKDYINFHELSTVEKEYVIFAFASAIGFNDKVDYIRSGCSQCVPNRFRQALAFQDWPSVQASAVEMAWESVELDGDKFDLLENCSLFWQFDEDLRKFNLWIGTKPFRPTQPASILEDANLLGHLIEFYGLKPLLDRKYLWREVRSFRTLLYGLGIVLVFLIPFSSIVTRQEGFTFSIEYNNEIFYLCVVSYTGALIGKFGTQWVERRHKGLGLLSIIPSAFLGLLFLWPSFITDHGVFLGNQFFALLICAFAGATVAYFKHPESLEESVDTGSLTNTLRNIYLFSIRTPVRVFILTYATCQILISVQLWKINPYLYVALVIATLFFLVDLIWREFKSKD